MLTALLPPADRRARRSGHLDARVGVELRGIDLHGRATGANARSVTFHDGTNLEVTTVTWATGFGLDHAWIDAPIFDTGGAIEHERGVTRAPGLYFLGLPWQHTRGSCCWAGSRTTPPTSPAA